MIRTFYLHAHSVISPYFPDTLPGNCSFQGGGSGLALSYVTSNRWFISYNLFF